MDVSIVIPTKNGGKLFDQVLDSIAGQKTQYTYEVICVDSGSSDETLQYIKNHGFRLHQIPKEEFGHGKTRNLGARLGSGEYIVFITQDALPANEYWLENFINAMKMDPDIVGGFGIHYPYPDCNILDRRDITGHFKGFGEENTIFSLEDPQRYKVDEGYRHYLAFFSDNNACLRRDIWEKYPYEDVNFAEDQIWARKMIELGYKKVYCPTAAVYHSHNYPLATYKKRYFDEYKGLYEIHKYVMVKDPLHLFGGYLKYVKNDLAYIDSLPLKDEEKKEWKKYAIKRDWFRFYSAYLAGKYHTWPEEKKKKMDQKFSQQFEQRNQ